MGEPINFSTDYILQNDRVLLRPLHMSDFVNLISFSVEEPELWKYSLQTAAQPENLQRYLKTATDNRSHKKEYPFIVFDKKANAYAGSTRFYDIQPEYKTVQLGYTWYGKEFQGTGLNRNCKYLLLELAFELWDMERVEFRADNENKRSIAAMKSIGCVVEGVLRNNVPKTTGGRRNSIVLSILKSEWEGGVKEMLRGKIGE